MILDDEYDYEPKENKMSFDDDYDYEPEEITLHPTKGVYIINAFTGKETKYVVGSKDEGRFWKVINETLSLYDSTPENFMGPVKGSPTYFFPSLEGYERFYEKTIDENRKISWRKKRLRLDKSKNQPSKPKMWMSKPKMWMSNPKIKNTK